MFTVGQRIFKNKWRWVLIDAADETICLCQDYAIAIGYAASLNSRKDRGLNPVSATVLARHTKGETTRDAHLQRVLEARRITR